MIQANELRIGNWVRHTNTFCKEEMQLDFDLIKNEINGNEFPELAPIPLTPEILERCGFYEGETKGVLSFYFSKNDEGKLGRQRLDFWGNNDKIELCYAGVCFKRVPCQSLHQLQNLYFALTGEELNIQL